MVCLMLLLITNVKGEQPKMNCKVYQEGGSVVILTWVLEFS
jgi:hypothetical protein